MTYFRESLTSRGIPEAEAYSSSFKILALLLVLGFILNFFVKPLNPKHFMTESQLKKEKDIAAKKDSDNALLVSKVKSNQAIQRIILPVAWIVVGLPIIWGISNALQKGIIIFH